MLLEDKMPKQLLDDMDWEQLCEHVLSKVGHQLKAKEIPTFRRWFIEREKIGYLFDYIMVLRCFRIWQELKDGLDHFIVISGREGYGKSTLSFQMAAWINPNFRLKHITYDAKQYLDLMGEKAEQHVNNQIDYKDIKSESIVMDEGTELLSKESMNITNRTLTKTFFIQRALKFLVIINIPNFHMLDSVIRFHRVRTLIEIIKRGGYKAITGAGILTVSKEGLPTKQVNSVRLREGQFWHGSYTKKFPNTIDKQEYEKFKMQQIKICIERLKDDVVGAKMVAAVKVSKHIGCSTDTIVRMIKEGKVKGKQIGAKWYITRQAYDKLLLT